MHNTDEIFFEAHMQGTWIIFFNRFSVTEDTHFKHNYYSLPCNRDIPLNFIE